jgi:23S rRNA (guanosine2251-2'-O)-methyltransferase
LHHGKEHQIFGIRAIIEAIQSGATVDKVYIQRKQEGTKDLMKVMKRGNINFSYVPVEKLNRLTPITTKELCYYLLFHFLI